MSSQPKGQREPTQEEQAVIADYRKLQESKREIAAKILELEAEVKDHEYQIIKIQKKTNKYILLLFFFCVEFEL